LTFFLKKKNSYGRKGCSASAFPCLLRALKIRKKVYGDNHPSTEIIQSWLEYLGWYHY